MADDTSTRTRGDMAAARERSAETATGAVLAVAVEALRPRMRGWLHAGAAFVSILTGVVLVSMAAIFKAWPAGWSTAVYSITILSLFGISGLYHRLDWGPRGQQVMKRLDHSMIFVFIAGTYTPIVVLALPRSTGEILLPLVWAGALAGVGVKMWWPDAPRWVGVPLYIALGWVAVFVFGDLLRGAGVAALVLIIVGGLAYTVGGIAYAFKRPDPYPATFGFHEVFHACTIVAATCHYIAIWLIVF
ncbi:MAG: channel protein hemolysin family [Frankiales bacterium]|nr:channel protein hemolysin family [Frankiales bacterium]